VRPAAGLAAALLLAGCQSTPPPVATATPFDPKAAAYIKIEGPHRIEGHAFLRKPNGSVANAVGETVRLVPATAYARERFAALYEGRKQLAAARLPASQSVDPAYAELTRTTKAGATGRFTFENVAPGDYIVATQVVWTDSGSLFRQGAAIWETVTVTGRETRPVRVIVNGF
jgi:hypothetical protein